MLVHMPYMTLASLREELPLRATKVLCSNVVDGDLQRRFCNARHMKIPYRQSGAVDWSAFIPSHHRPEVHSAIGGCPTKYSTEVRMPGSSPQLSLFCGAYRVVNAMLWWGYCRHCTILGRLFNSELLYTVVLAQASKVVT